MKKLKSNLVKHTPESRLYQIPVPIIGLTGGIATGKSTVAELFRKQNIPVIDADKLVKSIYKKSDTLDFIKKHFPNVIDDQDIISFKDLREIVFQDATYKKSLEDFIYTHRPTEFKKAYSEFPTPNFIVYDVPLLFEKKLNLLTDFSVCVYTPKEIQIERLMKRDQSTRELAEKILEHQMPIDEKKNKSDFVIENLNGLSELEHSFDQLLDAITAN